MRTAATVSVIICYLCQDEVVPYSSEDCFGARQCQAKRRDDGACAAAVIGGDVMGEGEGHGRCPHYRAGITAPS
jgi:hypothetical protein